MKEIVVISGKGGMHLLNASAKRVECTIDVFRQYDVQKSAWPIAQTTMLSRNLRKGG